MHRRGRNVSYDSHHYHLEAMLSNTKKIISRGVSPSPSRHEAYRERDASPYSRYSGPQLQDKLNPKKNVRYVFGSGEKAPSREGSKVHSRDNSKVIGRQK